MNRLIPLAAAFVLLSIAAAAAQAPTGKTCRLEQQCHWENFKKVCTYVKVCR
jgi:hypothetical protein